MVKKVTMMMIIIKEVEETVETVEGPQMLVLVELVEQPASIMVYLVVFQMEFLAAEEAEVLPAVVKIEMEELVETVAAV